MKASHLSDEQALDLALGETGLPGTGAHVEQCASCRERVEQARAGLHLAAQAEVPEPSPLFWDVLQRRISRRIEAEPARMLSWRWLTLAAAAASIVAIAVSMPLIPRRAETPRGMATIPAWTALPAMEEDAVVTILESALESAKEEFGDCRLGSCFMDLSEDEDRAAVALLQEELGRSI